LFRPFQSAGRVNSPARFALRWFTFAGAGIRDYGGEVTKPCMPLLYREN
jgi:hypothetical protein